MKAATRRFAAALAIASGLFVHSPSFAQVGTGWTAYAATLSNEVPPNTGTRYTFSNGVHHFWIFRSDPSTYPGRDSGPRSEVRVSGNWTSGQRQFQGEVNVEAGSNNVSLFQVFGASSRSTAFMMWATRNGSFSAYSGTVFFSGPIYGVYNRINVIHNATTNRITAYVNGTQRYSAADGGDGTHYFKLGVYHQKNMSNRSGSYWRNLRYFRK